MNRHHSRFGRWHAHQISAHRQAVSVATALTAPISATASADRAASTRTGIARPLPPPHPPASARITGSSTHGASIIGSVSDEIAPSVVSTRGDSVKATAAITREVGVPMPSASATRSIPQNPTTSSSAHHSRCVTQPGHAEQVTGEEERAVREQVAVGLVLRLAERQVAVPQVERAGQEAQRVGGEVELGVG